MPKWAVEATVNKKSRPCLEGGTFHGVAFVAALVLYNVIERGALWSRAQARAGEDLLAQSIRAQIPLREVIVRGGYACELFNRISFGVIVTAAKDRLFCGCRKGNKKE